MARKPKLVFEPVDPSLIGSGAKLIARTLLGYVATPTTNSDAIKKSARMLGKLGLEDSALYGPTAELDHFGHVIIFNVGRMGFLRIEVHNDSAYVEPLLLKKGQRPSRADLGRFAAGGCTVTKICTSTIDLNGGPSTCDFDDDGAEDPSTGIFTDYQYVARGGFDGDEIELLGGILTKAAALFLTNSYDKDPDALHRWLTDYKSTLRPTRAYVGVSRRAKVTWFDWLVVFANGSSSSIQVAKGDARPVFAPPGRQIDPDKFRIAYDAVPTSVRDQVIAFPHVTEAR